MSVKNRTQEFRVEYSGTEWAIVDPTNPGARLRIDQAVMDATRVAPNVVEGSIISVHGLEFEVASQLSRPTLQQLGVAANLRSLPPPPRHGSGMQRVRLEAGGAVVNVTRQ